MLSYFSTYVITKHVVTNYVVTKYANTKYSMLSYRKTFKNKIKKFQLTRIFVIYDKLWSPFVDILKAGILCRRTKYN